MYKKGQIGWQELLPWFIGAVVLVLMLLAFYLFYSKGSGLLEGLKGIFGIG